MRVLIVGGGVAGLEALLALRDLGEDRLDVTLVAAAPDFTYRPLTVDEPFTLSRRSVALEPIAAELGAGFVPGRSRGCLPTSTHRAIRWLKLDYDALVVCVGGKPTPAYAGGITFDAAREQLEIDELIEARGRRLAFVVPPGVTWPLPIYELALMTGEGALRRDRRARVRHLTPESAPLIIFGAASDAVAALLAARGIELDTAPTLASPRTASSCCARRARLDAERHRAADDRRAGDRGSPGTTGFIPIDEHARVRGRGGRLRCRGRDQLPDQAGRHRDPAGRRRRRAHRGARRCGSRAAAISARSARQAPGRRGVAPPSHDDRGGGSSARTTTCGGPRTRSAAATSRHGWRMRRRMSPRLRGARSMSRSPCPTSGTPSRWHSTPTVRSTRTRERRASSAASARRRPGSRAPARALRRRAQPGGRRAHAPLPRRGATAAGRPHDLERQLDGARRRRRRAARRSGRIRTGRRRRRALGGRQRPTTASSR